MMYKLRKIHMRQGQGKEHLAMCGKNISKASKSDAKSPNCENCLKVMRAAFRYNKFYGPYLP